MRWPSDPTGGDLASGSVSGEVKLWNLADVEPVRLPPPASWVTGLAFRRDGPTEAPRSPRRETNAESWVWDPGRPGSLTETSQASEPAPRGLGNRDGEFIRAGQVVPGVRFRESDPRHRGRDPRGRLREVDIDPQRPLRRYFLIAFSPDGSLVATGSEDRTVKIWDPKTGRELTTLRGYPGGIRSLAFSPDGHRLAAGGVGAEVSRLGRQADPRGKTPRGPGPEPAPRTLRQIRSP